MTGSRKKPVKRKDGEIVSILGPSGCVKTTLLNLILGITDVTEGKVIFNDKDMTHVPMEKRGFDQPA